MKKWVSYPSEKYSTLTELLRWRALYEPEQRAYTFLPDGEMQEIHLTYAELDLQARNIGAWLCEQGAAGDRVLLLYPPGLEFIAAFFGCLYAGAIAVPAYPPRLNQNLLRLQAIVADSQAGVALTTAPIMSRVQPLCASDPYLAPLQWKATDDVGLSGEGDRPLTCLGDDLAFFQYTSGSTGTPKGVMLTHANLLHNAALVHHAMNHTAADKYVSWLPTFHDMGFMAGVLQPLYACIPVVLMSPASFLQRPLRWLDAISRHHATTSGAPNFAYELCVNRITEEQKATLDLSSWNAAFNGAEPIRHETIRNFTEAFASCGFREEVFYPCYGLAEATLIVSGGLKSAPPVVKVVRSRELENNLIVEGTDAGQEARSLVGCGAALAEQRIVIVNPETLVEREPGRIGEIWTAGRSVARGYWNRPEETRQTFQARLSDTGEGPFLRTGDLGFIDGGELFVTGRLKDMIIIRGLNHYPQDIELTVERSHTAFRPGCGAAFSVTVNGDERLVIVHEVAIRQNPDADEVCAAAREAIARQHELQAHAVVLVKPGTIPKTSSGKLQRRECRARFQSGRLSLVAEWRESVMDGGATPAANLKAHDAEEIEKWLVSLFAARLGLDATSIDSSRPVTHYCLDSLAAIELMHGIESGLGVSLPMASFLQDSNIRQLALRAEAELRSGALAADRIEATPTEGLQDHPLSYGQQAMWFLYRLSPESAAYNIAAPLHIRSEVDASSLRRAFQKLLERHPTLRTSFSAMDGEPRARSLEGVEVDFRQVDACAWSKSFLDEQLIEEAYRPFKLESGKLLRLVLYRRSAHEHILMLTVHHIAADFWSLTVLMNELGKVYQAERNDQAIELLPGGLQYADYARWQQKMLDGPRGQRLFVYWEKQLAGELPPLNLMSDRPRPPAQTFDGASYLFKLEPELTDRLRTLGQTCGATLYMTLLAAFQALLQRHTGQEDILVGTPTSGRTHSELAGVVGYFVNPVVMRAEVSGSLTFKEFLLRTRQTVLEAFEHQDCPFPLLVKRLQPERDPSRSPLFQVMFVLQKAHGQGDAGMSAFALGEEGARMNLGGLSLESRSLKQRVAQFDLTLAMAETETGLCASFEYNTALFDHSTITRLSTRLTTLLTAISIRPEQQIAELPMLTEEERRQVVVEWNQTDRVSIATGAEEEAGECLHELIERQARRSPDAVAVEYDACRVTYRELNERANQLAHRLREMGVGAESLVGVLVERSVEMLVGLLGVLKAGGAYVPLDPVYPQGRLAYMINDSGLRLLLTQQSLLDKLPAQHAETLCLDADRSLVERQSKENLPRSTTPDNLAYVIYTSGSTGQPKGVQISHRAVVNFLHSMRREPGINDSDTLLSVTTLSFDIAVLELYLPLMVGARIILVSRETAADGERLASEIEASGTTLMQATPATWRLLLQTGWKGNDRLKMLCGGEALPRELSESLGGHGASLWNMYGPTETTVWSAVNRVEARGGTATIGRPIDNTQIYILDERLQPVPIGLPGELHIGGFGLARGYLRRVELTAERFIPDPFGASPGARLYKTGDLTRRLADGSIEFLGRLDHQVKLRGFRIELGEIEAALANHGEVRDCVAVIREDHADDKRLVAYLVAEQASDATLRTKLHDYLKERLPNYMLPSEFVLLDELPLTLNGKVDRKALPAPPGARSMSFEDFIAPRTPAEEILADIWKDVLRLETVSVHDDFFAVGGHSLKATQVISRISDAFGLDVPLRAIFAQPTPARLAAHIEQLMSDGENAQSALLMPVARDGHPPLSFAQQRLWFLSQMEAQSQAYHLPWAMRIEGSLDASTLEQSLSDIVARHESLRTTFRVENGRPVQIIAASRPLTIPVLDLRALNETNRELEAQRFIRDEISQSFDLEQGALLRATLLRLDDKEHILLLTMHHIISDGWSIGVLMHEMSAFYEARLAGTNAALPELPIQFADYAVWQKELLCGGLMDKQLGYWKQQLAGAQPLELQTDYRRPSVQSFEGAVRSFELNRNLSEQLKTLSRREGVTLFMTLLAATQTLLARYSMQDDIAVGTPVAGRTRVETEGLIGCFINTLVLRTDLAGNPSFRELLGRVREVSLEAYAHQDIPFEKLVEELQPVRDLSRNPLFQVMFALHNQSMIAPEISGLTLEPLPVEDTTAKFDLSFYVVEKREGLFCAVSYNRALFSEATIERMLAHLESLLQEIVSDPARRLSDFSLLSGDERRQLLWDLNATSAAPSSHVCLSQMFEAQVEQTPEAVAVVYAGEQLTYRELNERSNRLAHRLCAMGVGSDVLVGVMLERSVEMIVALLAATKAGGAYVPLDASYPPERLALILEESGLEVLLTSKSLQESRPLHASTAVTVLCIDGDHRQLDSWSSLNPRIKTRPDDLVYVIYTSGSTGRPKGVMVTHKGLVNYLDWAAEAYGTRRGGGAPVHTPLGFDLTVTSLLLSLVSGGTAVLLRESDGVEELAGALAVGVEQGSADDVGSEQFSLVKMTPAHLDVLSRVLGEDTDTPRRSRVLVIGGEALQGSSLRFWQQRWPELRLINEYGPTETVVGCCVYEVCEETNRAVPIGRPIRNTRLYVLDRWQQLTPMGAAGELYIGGDGLARGYLKQPALTAARFIPDPFSIEPGARLYKTGDLVRHLPDGNLEYLGRLDHQVKLRGFRIELGEIEAALETHEAVQAAVALMREDVPGDKRLVAYVVATETPFTLAEMRRHLKATLTEYMIPTALVTLSSFPLTSNGKVNRKALPAPQQQERAGAEEDLVGARTLVEELLVTVWSEVLGLERVGIHENFFALGGHSLLATQAVARMRDLFGVPILLHSMFSQPTVAEMASTIEELLVEQFAAVDEAEAQIS